MSHSDERMHILQMIEDGTITAAEGMRLLNALMGKTAPIADLPAPAEAEAAPIEPPLAESASPEPPPRLSPPPRPDPKLEGWKRWWMIPLGVGIGITLFGALLMYWAYSAAQGFNVWFVCASGPFAVGVLLMALAAASRTAKWIHIRVHTGEKKGEGPQRIAISLPLPIGLTAWFLRTFGSRIPQLKDTAVDELILALGESTSAETPLYVEVNEGDDGEKVQVYIG